MAGTSYSIEVDFSVTGDPDGNTVRPSDVVSVVARGAVRGNAETGRRERPPRVVVTLAPGVWPSRDETRFTRVVYRYETAAEARKARTALNAAWAGAIRPEPSHAR
jgi:hypothetical protein